VETFSILYHYTTFRKKNTELFVNKKRAGQ